MISGFRANIMGALRLEVGATSAQREVDRGVWCKVYSAVRQQISGSRMEPLLKFPTYLTNWEESAL